MTKKTALITGGSVGIGLELAKQFAAHGHDLVLVARHLDPLEAAAGVIEGKYGVNVTVLAADLANADSPEKLFEELTDKGIRIEYLVNNAGFGLGGAFADTDLQTELDMVQVNISSLVHLTKLFVQPMVHRKSGKIMNVGSTAAFQAGPFMAIYYATKAFVLSFSEAIDEELRGTGVSVTCLCPGPTSTHFAERAALGDAALFNNSAVATAEDVGVYGYAAMMRGDRIAIQGLGNKVGRQVQRFLPRSLVTRVVRKIQESR
ncbi:MAG: SDR family oxidoreductase [Gemmatimonadaceae bacterium]